MFKKNFRKNTALNPPTHTIPYFFTPFYFKLLDPHCEKNDTVTVRSHCARFAAYGALKSAKRGDHLRSID